MGDSAKRPKYEFVDINVSGKGAVRTAFANQVDYCEHNGAPITARIVAAIWAAIDAGLDNALARRIVEWQGPPLADALPLRVAGGIHALHLSGAEPALSPIYRGIGADDASIVGEAMRVYEAPLMPWLDGPPQTNEAGRSSNFVAAMLWLARKGLPPRFACLEIGSSAGINLMLDRYHYDLGGVEIGPDRTAMRFAPEWKGPPPPAEAIEIVSTRGCDVAPVDLTDPAQALRLRAYIWPEHTVRFERMEAAIRAAGERKPDLVKANAADFVEAELAKPQVQGTTRLLMHSIVWQYVPEEQQSRITEAMEAAGAKATTDRPLAWVSVEADRTVHRHMLKVRFWPGGDETTQLAWSHAHGADIDWIAG
ncbi:DUF2332 domain-containing protein [Erythrobacter mangrovi]|uniref:DUF2332 domain-containing protein n=1 Tax=Erythrobacter mangrovi TaxID=2739433 RepID=A0A7D3XGY1_9SPHN|nr:DUF2332 domain-containing protein [Erythrobacter mangrovi]QKG69959.1 DUF2332 domain-containing protein [Erythrobacter mangrovi]